MSSFEYLPHEYSYACYLAYIYDFSPYDSMISNMVSERYPREEDDDDASAIDSAYDEEEDEESEGVLTVSAQPMESSASRILFGSFESSIVPISTPSIEPKFDGFSIKIGEISCVIVDPCCNIVKEDDCVLVDSQEDEKLDVLESALENRSSDFVVSEAPEVLIDTLPVRSCSSVYGVAAVRLFASWLFVEKQSSHPVSAINNQVQFFQLHDEFIVDFDPGGSIFSRSLFSVFPVLRYTSFRLRWKPWDRGKKGFVSVRFNTRITTTQFFWLLSEF
jgi:hypothetical protein